MTAATVPLLTPTIRAFRETHDAVQVEVVTAQQEGIHRDLRGGGLDLGLVNYLGGEELPADLETTELLRGRPSSASATTARSPPRRRSAPPTSPASR